MNKLLLINQPFNLAEDFAESVETYVRQGAQSIKRAMGSSVRVKNQ